MKRRYSCTWYSTFVVVVNTSLFNWCWTQDSLFLVQDETSRVCKANRKNTNNRTFKNVAFFCILVFNNVRKLLGYTGYKKTKLFGTTAPLKNLKVCLVSTSSSNTKQHRTNTIVIAITSTKS
jgi:hypothetical protein